jgi:hypothetical protein
LVLPCGVTENADEERGWSVIGAKAERGDVTAVVVAFGVEHSKHLVFVFVTGD